MQHCVMTWQRQILGVAYWKDDRISDEDFMSKRKLRSVARRWAKHRLLYGFQLVDAAPDFVFRVIALAGENDPHSWIQVVRQALPWLADPVASTIWDTGFADPALASVEEVSRWLRQHRRQGQGLVKRASHRRLMQEAIAHDVRDGPPCLSKHLPNMATPFLTRQQMNNPDAKRILARHVRKVWIPCKHGRRINGASMGIHHWSGVMFTMIPAWLVSNVFGQRRDFNGACDEPVSAPMDVCSSWFIILRR